LISEIYGFTPIQISELTISQLNTYRSYAYKAKTENLLSFHNFAEGKYNLPGVTITTKESTRQEQVREAIKQYQNDTGKKTITPEDWQIISKDYLKEE
jgi:hypothetical protein